MPFCTKCGTKVGDSANFCANCGSAQTAGSHASATSADFLGGMSGRTASILCYIPVFGVIPAIVFLASQHFRGNLRVRFDGFQSLYLFVAWLILDSAAPTLLFNGGRESGVEHSLLSLLRLAVLVCWVYLLINAAQQKQIRLPVIGDLASRSTSEQL